MSRRKILHVISGLGRGGAENILRLICTSSSTQFEHFVVSLGKDNARAEEFHRLGIQTLRFNGNIAQLVTQKLPFNPDVLVGWMYHGNLAALYYKKFKFPKTPLIWSIRQGLDNYQHLKWTTRLTLNLGKKLSQEVKRISYNGQLSMAQHEKFGYPKEKSFYFPNGVDTEVFAPRKDFSLRNQLNMPASSCVIIQSARLAPEKNYPLFFKVATRLSQEFENLHFICMGLGLEPEKRESLLAEQKVPAAFFPRFHFLGAHKSPQVGLNNSDIFCQTSDTEAFSNSLLEAMSCGLAISTTKVGDSPQIIADTGLLSSKGDEQQLFDNLKKLIQDPDLRNTLGLKARERVMNNYSLDQLFASFNELTS